MPSCRLAARCLVIGSGFRRSRRVATGGSPGRRPADGGRSRAGCRLRALLLVLGGIVAGPVMALDTQDCVILPGAEVALGAPTSGLIRRVLVDRNEPVAAGEIVAELHAEVEEAAHALASLRASDDSAIRTAEIWLAFEKQLLDRTTALSTRDVVSQQVLAERRANYEIRASELAEARVALEQAQLELAQAEARLEVRRVRSPIDGVVVERLLSAGEYLREDTPLLRLVALKTLWVEVFLPQSAYPSLHPGARATVIPESGIGAEREAVVETVDPLIDPASGTFGVRLRLDNADRSMVAGVRCTARFDID